MKKVLQALLFIFVFTYALKSTVTAQSANKNYYVSVDKIKSYLEFEKKLKADESVVSSNNLESPRSNARALKANFKASADFKKHFKDAAEVNWTAGEDAIVGSFTKDNVKTNVVYDKKGSWIHTLVYSDENKMPKKLASLIEDAYPGYNVTLCVEISESNLVFHIIQIESKKMFKQLGIYDGQVEVLQQFTKQQR